jgi:hypothetical protein
LQNTKKYRNNRKIPKISQYTRKKTKKLENNPKKNLKKTKKKRKNRNKTNNSLLCQKSLAQNINIFLVEDVGSKLSLPVIRLFDKMASDSDPTALLSDGLHFSAAGNKILSDLVEPFLDPLDKMQAPDWKHFLTA